MSVRDPNTHPRQSQHVDDLTSFPPSDSPHLVLIAPTHSQKLQQFTANGASWRGPLDIPTYLERELHMSNQSLTKDNGLTYWILVDGSLPPEKQIVLSGCETLKKRAVVARPDGWVMEVQCHGVGSVFCPVECRGRGYAGRMMKELGEKLKTWQGRKWGEEGRASKDGDANAEGAIKLNAVYDPNYPKDNLFSVLWSDIGKSFYAKQGWMPFPSAQISIPSNLQISSTLDLPTVTALYAQDIANLTETDEQLICQSMVRTCHAKGKTHVAILPDARTITWHHAREEFVASKIYQSAPSRMPDTKGAIVNADRPGHRVWCYFGHSWESAPSPTPTKGNKLYIMRLVVEEVGMYDWETADSDPQTLSQMQTYVPAIASLLAFAVREAKEWDLHSIELWNPTKAVVDAASLVVGQQVEVTNREMDSVPSLLWFGNGEKTEGVAENTDGVVWLGNDKYGWC